MADRLITDVGGLPAGEVPREEVPQLYWEKLMIAMFNVLVAKGFLTLDEFRRAVEEMSPETYRKTSFYNRRLDCIARLLDEKGLISADVLARRTDAILAAGTRDHVG
ncbi:SH3-like domain-containing protein [Aquabacter spiritensis]|uniref:Nitrile hydratase beta subunit n=1 Tax=Aquabacter spiritensis TaxID=933073 RepID=A0A4R3LVY7_9HYPH|nr:SH3-like domain-containing protein [Aquabacter spiritensis]TCT04752.1 nitrile hydratase beta subunit [Aquabacter spiritensis]